VAASRAIGLRRRAQVRFLYFARSRYCALLVCTVGIAVLIYDAWPASVLRPRINLHAVFGLLLWIMVVVQFERGARSPSLLQQENFHLFCRRLARAVYLLLYILFGANQLIGFGVLLWNRGSLGALHPAILQPPENLRDYLVYGIIALLTIHALAALHRHMQKRGGLTSTFPDYQHYK
jgi:cytochrome b561